MPQNKSSKIFKRKIVIVVSDVARTKFMQSAGVFEKFKFVGLTLAADQRGEPTAMTAKELLDSIAKNDVLGHATVGIIVPGGDATFLPDYKVFSDGERWITVEDMCKCYDSELTL